MANKINLSGFNVEMTVDGMVVFSEHEEFDGKLKENIDVNCSIDGILFTEGLKKLKENGSMYITDGKMKVNIRYQEGEDRYLMDVEGDCGSTNEAVSKEQMEGIFSLALKEHKYQVTFHPKGKLMDPSKTINPVVFEMNYYSDAKAPDAAISMLKNIIQKKNESYMYELTVPLDGTMMLYNPSTDYKVSRDINLKN